MSTKVASVPSGALSPVILRRGHAQGSEKNALKPDWYSAMSSTSVCQYELAPPTKPRGSSQCNQPRAMASAISRPPMPSARHAAIPTQVDCRSLAIVGPVSCPKSVQGTIGVRHCPRRPFEMEDALRVRGDMHAGRVRVRGPRRDTHPEQAGEA